jgi:hypothetical protein
MSSQELAIPEISTISQLSIHMKIIVFPAGPA